VGGADNFFHCSTCGCCYAKSLEVRSLVLVTLCCKSCLYRRSCRAHLGDPFGHKWRLSVLC
jgi:hypothetical protein